MTDLAQIIERLEKATGPDREIDTHIFWHTDRARAQHACYNAMLGKPRPLGDEMPKSGLGRLAIEHRAPRYTAIIDKALLLVPEGWSWRLDHHLNSGAALYRDLFPQIFSIGETPAIALCIAALRARAALTDYEGKAE